MIDAIFLAPASWYDKDTKDDGEELKANLKGTGWTRPPSLQMPSTRVYQNKMLVHVMLDDADSIGEIASLVPGQCVGAQGAIIPAVWDFSPLDGYEPQYVETFPIDPETGEPSVEPVMELVPPPQPILVSAESREVIVPLSDKLIDYMPDMIDENDNVTRPTTLSLHQFGGRPWYLGA